MKTYQEFITEDAAILNKELQVLNENLITELSPEQEKQIDEAIEDDLDLEDDEYMKEYRDKRLAELKEKANQHFYPHGMIDITK